MQPNDVKIEHKEHGMVDEMGNAEKAMCLHFGGLQADGAGLRDGSLGFLTPRFTLGSHQAEVCEIPSPILCKAIPLQHTKCTSVPEPCPEGTEPGSRADHHFSRCWWLCLLPWQKVCTQADTSTGHRNAHSTGPWGAAPAAPIPCKAESLGTKCTDNVQCDVTPDEAFKTRILHWQDLRVNGDLKNLTEHVLCRISADSAWLGNTSFLPLLYRALCPQCDASSACT